MISKRGRNMYVPQELIAEIERIQRQLGISQADAMRLIMRRGDSTLEGFRI